MLVSDLIRVNAAPQVISLGAIERLKRELREGAQTAMEDDPELNGLLGQYFISESNNRQAIEAIFRSLNEQTGASFLVCGPYGAGKSHLLAIISLLTEFPICRQIFLKTHPEFSRFLSPKGRKLLVVQVALDDYSGPDHSLEEIVFNQIEAELAAPWHKAWAPLAEASYFFDLFAGKVLPGRDEAWQGFLKEQKEPRAWEQLKSESPKQAGELAQGFLERIGLPLAYRRSRAETIAALFEHLANCGYDGAALLIDELSTFLASKDKQALNRDGSFLQFMGQQSGTLPLWIVATAQRSLEEVGDIDSHTLRQIRDRFRGRFTLSIAEIRRVIANKLIEQCDAKHYFAQISEIYRKYLEGAGQLSFSAEELRLCYPVNPPALDGLESIAGNFLSSTRSLIGMVQRGLLSGDKALCDEEADRLLTLDCVFDLEGAELLGLPEAFEYRKAWEFLSRNMAAIFEPADLAKAEIIIKHLLLVSMAGFRWPVKRYAEAFIGSQERELWGNVREVERLLKRLWRKGAYVEVNHSAEVGGSEYFLEVSTDLSELVRRRINEALAALSDTDERVCEWALQACNTEDFPLASFAAPRALGLEWMGGRRYINIERCKPTALKMGELAQAAAALESPSCREDGWLFICQPCRNGEEEKAAWPEQAKEVKGRFGESLLVWLHKPFTEQEWEIICEHAALNLLLADATLASSRKGREVRARLKARLAGVKEECQFIIKRAYLAGEILNAGGGTFLTPLAYRAEKWEELLAGFFSKPLNNLFPHFPAIAPRQRLVGKLHTNQIIDRFIRPGQAALPAGSALEEHLSNYLEPLGFLSREGDRYTLGVPGGELVEQVLGLLPEPTQEPQPGSVMSYRELEGRLRKGAFGLVPEQTELILAALARLGYVQGLDGFLSPIHLNQAAAPLADNFSFLMKSSPLAERDQTWLAAMGKRLFNYDAIASNPAAQETLWDKLQNWRAQAIADLPELNRLLETLIGSLKQEPILWSESLTLLKQMPCLLERDLSNQAAATGIGLFMQHAQNVMGDAEAALEVMEKFARLRVFLQQSAGKLGQAYGYVSDAGMILPKDSALAKQRAALLDKFSEGEGIMLEADLLLSNWESLHHAYQNRYLAWHTHQHTLIRFRQLLEVKESAIFCLAENIARACAIIDGDFARLAAELRQALGRRCSGAALPAALQTHPVCPECNLQLNENTALPDAMNMRARLEKSLAEMKAGLLTPERIGLLRRRLEGEAPGELRRRLERLTAPAPPLKDVEFAGLFSADVAAWIGKQLNLQVSAKRKAAALSKLLSSRELTKAQALEIFLRWLDEHNNLSEGDLIAIE
jgi:hypothetical protein